MIAARELDLAGNDNRNWVNDHTVYTHGYGVVAAYGNKVTADGQPEFFESGIPTQGKLTESEKYAASHLLLAEHHRILDCRCP